jgi:hypothetical protein
MEASGNGDVVGAIAKGGVEGRTARNAVRSLTKNDPEAQRMIDALVRYKQSSVQKAGNTASVLATAAGLAHFVPIVGNVLGGGLAAAKFYQMAMDKYLVGKALGSHTTYKDVVKAGVSSMVKEHARRAGATIGSSAGAQQ